MPADLPSIFFAHANGFPATAYQHFFGKLSPYQVYYEEVLSPGTQPIKDSWDEVVSQLIDSIERQVSSPVVGLGHSFGAVVMFRAAQQRPDLFRQLIMMEPPLLAFKLRFSLTLLRGLGLAERLMPLAKQALNRKDHFNSREEARAYWGQKRFFQSFDPACFEEYVQYGLVAAEDGGFQLKIPKSKEANIFIHPPSRFGDTSLDIPAHYLYATKGNTLPAESVKAYEKRFSDFNFHEWKGGHMFPLESPEEVGTLIKSLILK
ncbi:MAG: alpha/beta hydrolase [Bacteroidia bacterium]